MLFASPFAVWWTFMSSKALCEEKLWLLIMSRLSAAASTLMVRILMVGCNRWGYGGNTTLQCLRIASAYSICRIWWVQSHNPKAVWRRQEFYVLGVMYYALLWVYGFFPYGLSYDIFHGIRQLIGILAVQAHDQVGLLGKVDAKDSFALQYKGGGKVHHCSGLAHASLKCPKAYK